MTAPVPQPAPSVSPRAVSGLVLPGLPPLGSLCLASLLVCAASGLALLPGFDHSRGAASILHIELVRPWGWFFRGLHAWSAQLALLTLVLHTIDFVARKADREQTLGRWLATAATVPVMLYLMIGGYALTGDAEAGGVAAVMRGLLQLLGAPLASAIAGGTRLLYIHHVASAMLVLLVLVAIHLRRVLPDVVSVGMALGVSGLVALAVRPSLGPLETTQPLHGPWFMAGLRWMLQVVPAWACGIALPAAALVLLGSLPRLQPRAANVARWTLGAATVAYAAITLMAVLR